jgi:hypothetical protein
MSPYIEPSHEEIALCAYFIYIHEGCPQGQELAHWFEAENQLVVVRWHDAKASAD